MRLCILGLAIALVVPCSTHITNYVAADLTAYVEETIAETENGADKLNTAMESDEEGKNIFEKLSELFQTAIRDISDLLLHFQNNIRRCMNSIANAIEKDLRTRLEKKFDTAANGQAADDLAIKMVKEVYEPIVKAIDRRYTVIVEFSQ